MSPTFHRKPGTRYLLVCDTCGGEWVRDTLDPGDDCPDCDRRASKAPET
jgi:hypothetical protein